MYQPSKKDSVPTSSNKLSFIRLAQLNIKRVYENKLLNKIYELSLKQKLNLNYNSPTITKTLLDVKQQYSKIKITIPDSELKRINQSYTERLRTLIYKSQDSREPFELFKYTKEPPPKNRIPAPGIIHLPFQYHTGRTTTAVNVSDEGYTCNPIIEDIIKKRHIRFIHVLSNYRRPLGTTDAIFADFNRPQVQTYPPEPERAELVLSLVQHHLQAKRYRPIAFKDIIYSHMPLNTGTGYFYRHSFKAKSNAKYTHPEAYAESPTSKGYYVNFHYMYARQVVHDIKQTGMPFPLKEEPKNNASYYKDLGRRLNLFFMKHPTMLFMRNHISKKGELKTRPVYGVDDIFLHMEAMLTLPLLVQGRKMDCAIMHSLETLRGGNHKIDAMAKKYQTYATLDFSSFDQTTPWPIVDLYYSEFLPSLIIINKGFQPTFIKPVRKTSVSKRFWTMSNILNFVHTWYRNMVFVNADGHAYKRTFAGVPSGLLNTQQLDSFINLFVIIDSMIAYGITPAEIQEMKILIMGDDNTFFTHRTLPELTRLVKFISTYTAARWNMIIKPEKSNITDRRDYIEVLSYRCNFGFPAKDIEKLCAQLCYPEHGFKEKFASYRALGIAFASCGRDREFYDLCKDVYTYFYKYAEVITPQLKNKMAKYLPGIFKTLDDPTFFLEWKSFPSIEDIQEETRVWKGELPFHPKWDSTHFIHTPNHELEDTDRKSVV